MLPLAYLYLAVSVVTIKEAVFGITKFADRCRQSRTALQDAGLRPNLQLRRFLADVQTRCCVVVLLELMASLGLKRLHMLHELPKSLCLRAQVGDRYHGSTTLRHLAQAFLRSLFNALPSERAAGRIRRLMVGLNPKPQAVQVEGQNHTQTAHGRISQIKKTSQRVRRGTDYTTVAPWIGPLRPASAASEEPRFSCQGGKRCQCKA